jgi:hypothetical protein
MKTIIKEAKFEILTTEMQYSFGAIGTDAVFQIEFCDAYKNEKGKWCFHWTLYSEVTETSRLRAARWIKAQPENDFFIHDDADGGITVSAVVNRETEDGV